MAWCKFLRTHLFLCIITKVMLLLITSGCAAKDGCDLMEVPPKIRLAGKMDTEITEPNELGSNFLNETILNEFDVSWSSLVFQNCMVRVEFLCEANYPIEWIEIHHQDLATITDLQDGKIHKNMWVDRPNNHESLHDVTNSSSFPIDDPKMAVYSAFLGLTYESTKEPLCLATNYSCRSVDSQCLQSNVISVVNSKNKTIRYQMSTEIIDADVIQSKPCEGTITVYFNPKEKQPGPGFQCPNFQNGTRAPPITRGCDSAENCNTYFLRHKQKCVKRVTSVNDCDCRYANVSQFHPGFIYCQNENREVVTALQYFYSVPHNLSQKTPEMYFDWAEADPQKMMYLEPTTSEAYVGESITLFCRVSRFYFAFGHRFGFEHKNGSMVYTNSIDGEKDEKYNFMRMNTTLTITDPVLHKIYCFAPVWNSSVWINQSYNIVVRDDPKAPTIVEDQSTELEILLHERNKSLSCKASGLPIPAISWSWENNEVAAIQVEVGPGNKELLFPFVSNSTSGIYTCTAKNFMGSTSKTFNVVVKDAYATLLQFTIAFCCFLVFTFLLTLIFCWKKISKQRRLLRALTDAEIKEFREGNLEVLQNQEYLDTQELLHALPYNDEFEIPSERLHIDASKILGTGNFGQVVKGAIVNGQGSGSYVEVAVKTVKPKYDVLYFKTLLTEVKIMAYIGRHVNVVSLVGACTQNLKKRQIYIAVEFCAKGSLEKLLKGCRPTFANLICDDTFYVTTSFIESYQPKYENLVQQETKALTAVDECISTTHLVKWSREIANGMEFLGSKKIVHGDLASRNVLLTQDFVAKIGDFGLSRQLMEYSNYVRSNGDDCILPWKWMAIETLQDMKFSVMSDVWSYGVTLWEIFSLAQLPYPGVTWSPAFLEHIHNGLRLHKPNYSTSQIYNLMLECWAIEPSQRPNFTELKDFFEGLQLQTCNDDYFHANTTVGKNRGYINEPRSIHVNNPGYSILSTRNMCNGGTQSTVHEGGPMVMKFMNGNHGKVVTATEDDQGYLRPLISGCYDEEV